MGEGDLAAESVGTGEPVESPEKEPTLFDLDPLLLKADSQRKYASKLVHNLVIGRSLSVCSPEYHRLDRERKSAIAVTTPPPELVDKYEQSRSRRTPVTLSADEKDLLEDLTMRSRAEKTTERRPDDKGNRRYKEDPEVRPNFQNRLRIAAVGFRVRVSKLGEQGFFNENLCPLDIVPAIQGLPDSRELNELGRTRPLLPINGAWARTIGEHIEVALNAGSHIVVLPELTLPPSSTGSSVVRKIAKLSKNAVQTPAYPSQPSKPDHFVFAGSRHEGGYNRGLVVRRRDQRFRMKWHYKMASARSLGENVLGSRDDRQWSYPVRAVLRDGPVNINVMVAICYEAFDPSTFLNLVLHSAKQLRDKQERFIIVPAFNPSSEFVEMLRDLSFLAACPVLYVDGLHGEARMFISGIAMRDVTVKGRIRTLLNEEITKLRETLQKISDDVRETTRDNPNFRYMEKERLAASQIETRIDKLETLSASLTMMDTLGQLDNLITVERCKICNEIGHTDDYDCRNDIIYYNIDYDLVRHFTKFRRTFFAENLYLPEALRADALADASIEMDKRAEKRARRNKTSAG